jgi:hypothetical protein
MSILTANPLYSTPNFTNTAFAVTYTGTFFKIVFAAPISQTYFLNRELYNVKYSDLGANYVDLGEFDWGILTVNYALCTAPVAGSRNAWIDAVNALITNPSSTITLSAGNYLTDTYVGYNQGTQQLTDLGTRVYFWAQKTNVQAITGPGTTPNQNILWNTIQSDTASAYNVGTGVYTIPQTGDYQIAAALGFANQVIFSLSASGSSPYGAGAQLWFATQVSRDGRSMTLRFTAGDQISIKAIAFAVASTNLSTVAGDCYWTVTRVFT